MPPVIPSRILLTTVAVPLGAGLLGLIFWHLRNTDPMWAVVSFVLVYDPDMKKARSAGLSRLAHTVVGTAVALGLIALAGGPHKWLMPLGLAVGALYCGLVLRFQSTWRVVMITIALVVGAYLFEPATGVHVAFLRAGEVFAGSILAISFSWLAGRVGQA